MELPPFEFVCAQCLASHGLLESEQLPAACPGCGAGDPWVGPFVRVGDGDPDASDHPLYLSPFYMAAGRADTVEASL